MTLFVLTILVINFTLLNHVIGIEHKVEKGADVAYGVNALTSQISGLSGPHQGYYGTFIGELIRHTHGVTGDVYIGDKNRIIIREFNYDGSGPDPIFWAGTMDGGFHIPEARGRNHPSNVYFRGFLLFSGRYIDQEVVLEIPPGQDIKTIMFLSVFSPENRLSYADVKFPSEFIIPSPINVGPLLETRQRHNVSSGPVIILDAQTFMIRQFTYDGTAPAVHWWVTRGARQTPEGTRLNDENGSNIQLSSYLNRDVIISLPNNATIYDYDLFGIWCAKYFIDFGHVKIPQYVRVPPSERMMANLSPTQINTDPIPPAPSISGIRDHFSSPSIQGLSHNDVSLAYY